MWPPQTQNLQVRKVLAPQWTSCPAAIMKVERKQEREHMGVNLVRIYVRRSWHHPGLILNSCRSDAPPLNSPFTQPRKGLIETPTKRNRSPVGCDGNFKWYWALIGRVQWSDRWYLYTGIYILGNVVYHRDRLNHVPVASENIYNYLMNPRISHPFLLFLRDE